MAMKKYLKLIIVALVIATNVNAQINDTEYEMTKTYAIIDPTMYVKAMNRILMQSDFDTKWRLMEALDIAERKRKYMYNHKNFKIFISSFI